MAGIADELKSQFQGNESKLIGPVMGLLSGSGGLGGVSGLLEKFKGSGAGAQADSWVSKDANQPVSSQQVQNAIGDDKVQQIAQQTGMSNEQASQGIAKVLPAAVDKVTPAGAVPSGDELEKHLGGMAGKLFG